jgi:spermidine/putrescine transport system permease protein
MTSSQSSQTALAKPATAKRAFRVGVFPGFGAWSWAVLFYLYLPLVVLVVFSFNSNRTVTIWESFSLDWYAKAFANESIQDALRNTLIVGVIATVISTAVATLTAIIMVRGKTFRTKGLVSGTLVLPLIIPEIVTAVATLIFFVGLERNFGLNLGLGKLIIAHTVFCIPFAYLPIQARLQSMDATLEQAARDLYANEWQAFRRVTLPLLIPGIISGALLAFVVSIDDFIISQLVSGAGTTTLPVYIYGMVRTGITPEVNAVSTVILAVSILIVLVASLIGRRSS